MWIFADRAINDEVGISVVMLTLHEGNSGYVLIWIELDFLRGELVGGKLTTRRNHYRDSRIIAIASQPRPQGFSLKKWVGHP